MYIYNAYKPLKIGIPVTLAMLRMGIRLLPSIRSTLASEEVQHSC